MDLQYSTWVSLIMQPFFVEVCGKEGRGTQEIYH